VDCLVSYTTRSLRGRTCLQGRGFVVMKVGKRKGGVPMSVLTVMQSLRFES